MALLESAGRRRGERDGAFRVGPASGEQMRAKGVRYEELTAWSTSSSGSRTSGVVALIVGLSEGAGR